MAAPTARVRTQTSTIPVSASPGAQANIWVLVMTSGGGSQYKQVATTLEAQDAYGNIWVDNSLLGSVASFSGSSLAQTVQTIASEFDNAYASDTTHFGSPDYTTPNPGTSSVEACDSSGNKLGTTPSMISEPADHRINVVVLSGVAGYFSGVNYATQAALNCYNAKNPSTPRFSNEAPTIYLGWFNANPQLELGEDYVRGSAHQLQHLINFVNHQLTASTPGAEELWINEGLSILAQDFAVNKYSNIPFDALDALSDAAVYLATPQNFSITGFVGYNPAASFCNGCYGGAYLFQRYMYDRFGGDTYSRGMVTSGAVGFANLQANSAGEQGVNLLQDFALSLGVNALGLRAPSAQYTFGTLNLTYGKYPSQVPGITPPTLNGVGSTSISPNTSANLIAPVGGFAYTQLAASAGENFSITDTTPANGFGLVGGLIQY
jgi:hypothetical protein